MVDSICIFEGLYYTRLLPLTYFRTEYDLRCGILTLREKVKHQFPDIPIALHSRGYLADSVKQQNPNSEVNMITGKSCLFINGRVIVDENFRDKISLDGIDKLYVKGDTIIAARVSGNKLELLKHQLSDIFTFSDFTDLVKEEVDVKVVNYPWDLIANNGEQIIADFKTLTKDVKGSKIKV